MTFAFENLKSSLDGLESSSSSFIRVATRATSTGSNTFGTYDDTGTVGDSTVLSSSISSSKLTALDHDLVYSIDQMTLLSELEKLDLFDSIWIAKDNANNLPSIQTIFKQIRSFRRLSVDIGPLLSLTLNENMKMMSDSHTSVDDSPTTSSSISEPVSSVKMNYYRFDFTTIARKRPILVAYMLLYTKFVLLLEYKCIDFIFRQAIEIQKGMDYWQELKFNKYKMWRYQLDSAPNKLYNYWKEGVFSWRKSSHEQSSLSSSKTMFSSLGRRNTSDKDLPQNDKESIVVPEDSKSSDNLNDKRSAFMAYVNIDNGALSSSFSFITPNYDASSLNLQLVQQLKNQSLSVWSKAKKLWMGIKFLAYDETNGHLIALQNMKKELATRLGDLTCESHYETALSSSSVVSSDTNGLEKIAQISIEKVPRILNHLHSLLTLVINKEIPFSSTKYDEFNLKTFKTDFSATQLESICNLLLEAELSFTNYRNEHGSPSLLTQSWISWLTGGTGLYFILKIARMYSGSILHWYQDVLATIGDFFKNWVIGPLVSMYETVRHKESRLVLMGTKSLQSDLDSLERMVVEFSRDNGITDELRLDKISRQVQVGDLSAVMRQFENEIKEPLRNLILGDLIRSLFIQIQKAKVDGELAMSALDKLLKSNELNFAILAVVPSFAILGYLSSTIQSRILQSTQKSKHIVVKKLRKSLRNVERLLLNLEKDSEKSREHQTIGNLLLELNNLRYVSSSLPTDLNQIYMEDVRDLESSKMTVESKLRVLERMWRLYV